MNAWGLACLVAVFLAVSGAVVWIGLGAPGRRAGGMSGRLQRIGERREAGQEALLKARQATPWARLPGGAALADLLLRSGSAQTAGRVLTLGLGSALLVGLLAVLAGSSLAGALLLAMPAAPWPLLRLLHLAQRRRQRFEDQLPEALDLMTRALRAGYGLSMALGMVGEQLQDPLASEFRQVFEQLQLGQDFGQAMGAMAQRVRSQDLHFLLIALTIQRKTGGNLTELLGSLARTMRERIKLKGKVRVLSSEGRLSGLMIGALPFVLGLLLTLINPGYMASLWTTETGHTVVGVGLFMLALGAAWMWKIVQIKV